jgi:hypothetical protein
MFYRLLRRLDEELLDRPDDEPLLLGLDERLLELLTFELGLLPPRLLDE